MNTNPLDPTPNPYQSPASDAMLTPNKGTLLDGTQVRGKLFSAGHVAWATFLATPIAGCVLMAINYQRMEKSSAAKVMWFTTLAVFAGFILIVFMLPESSPTTIINLVLVFTMYHTANSLQGRDFARVISTGGSKASAWAATGIAVLVVVAFFAVLFGVALMLPEEMLLEEGEM